jgi:hypothetical protein
MFLGILNTHTFPVPIQQRPLLSRSSSGIFAVPKGLGLGMRLELVPKEAMSACVCVNKQGTYMRAAYTMPKDGSAPLASHRVLGGNLEFALEIYHPPVDPTSGTFTAQAAAVPWLMVHVNAPVSWLIRSEELPHVVLDELG